MILFIFSQNNKLRFSPPITNYVEFILYFLSNLYYIQNYNLLLCTFAMFIFKHILCFFIYLYQFLFRKKPITSPSFFRSSMPNDIQNTTFFTIIIRFIYFLFFIFFSYTLTPPNTFLFTVLQFLFLIQININITCYYLMNLPPFFPPSSNLFIINFIDIFKQIMDSITCSIFLFLFYLFLPFNTNLLLILHLNSFHTPPSSKQKAPPRPKND